ncbi:MAG: NTP transferase domain-containing protein [Spirochaetes bacterium]|nr:NTP transferase domain-containing protein [Spirochaetota bacterium]
MIQAVIMAGGEGTRLRPLTCNRSKPMVPVINKPVIEHAINLLKRHGIRDIIISLYYLPENVQNYFGDGSEWDVSITYSLEETPLGTAGGVKRAVGECADTVVVLSGDGIIDFHIGEILEFHRRRESPFTIVLKKVSKPTEYGIVITREDGRIERFLEKPSWSEVFSDTANTGLYVISPSIINDYIPPAIKYDFSFDLFPLLQEKNVPLYGYIAEGYWCDIGNIPAYCDVHNDILGGMVNVDFPGKKIARNVWAGRDVEIHPGASVKGPVIIGDFVRIKEGAEVSEFSVIGDNCVIEEEASIRKSIILHNTVIGPGSELRGAVIGKRCVLEQHVSVFEGSVISDDCRIGAGVEISAGIRVWPDKYIEQGTRLTEDIIWGQREKKTLFTPDGITGTFNVKITPEFASRLGSAIGAFLGRNAKITVSRDTTTAARIIMRAFTAGLLSMGVDVYDMEIESIPVNRYTTRFLNADMGAYIQISPLTELQFIQIRLMDKYGFQLPLGDEKKIENIFFRGDYPRKEAFDTGKLLYPSHHIESYIHNIAYYLDDIVPRERKWNVIVDCFNGTAAHVFPAMLSEYGCETMVLRGQIKEFASEEETKSDTRAAINNIMKMARMNNEIGVIVGPHSNHITVIDEKGEILTDDDVIAVLCLYYLKYRKESTINIPVTSSITLERLIHSHGGRAVHTSTMLRSPEGITDIFLGGPSGRYPYLELEYDPMFCFLRILQFLTLENTALHEIKPALPKGNIIHTSIYCTTDQKAAVMRELSSDAPPDKLELVDGVRINNAHAWVLVLPDASHPLVHVYCEGETPATRDEILEEYSERIKKYLAGI